LVARGGWLLEKEEHRTTTTPVTWGRKLLEKVEKKSIAPE
jgi:hypothetical protein